jgi:hypothetical protein
MKMEVIMKLVEVLNADSLREILVESAPVEEIVDKLFQKGHELSAAVDNKEYRLFEEFKEACRRETSELDDLEGPSDINPDDVVILRGCPMADVMGSLNENGKPPEFHGRIVEEYKQQNPGSDAILHPGCIAHQVARQLIVKNIEIDGNRNLNYYQLACRSGATGKVVYDENGLRRTGLSRDRANELIDGYACLYAIVKVN